MNNPTLILVDGSSYLYRAFHALPALTNSQGQPTGAIYGVANMLRKLIKENQADYMAVVFDAKGKTFRDELYADYKSHRPPMPDDLISQIALLHQLVRAMGIPLLEIAGYEADDVIGTLAIQAEQAGLHTIISTGDKDFAQLVNEHITLVNTMNDTVLDAAAVEEKFGIPPSLIIDYLALMGDSVDNVPGVPKVGPKTAVKWLQEYGSLDGIIQHADQIKGKVGENLRNAIAQLPLSKLLVTIKVDTPLSLTPHDLVLQTVDNQQLITLLKQLEFKSWLAEMLDNHVSEKNKNYQTITTSEALHKWLANIEQTKLFAFDTETTSLDTLQAELVGVSLAVKPHHAVYIPCAHQYAEQQIAREELLTILKPFLEDPAYQIIGHHLKYDFAVMKNYGITLDGMVYDTLLQSYVLQSGNGRHDMDTLALKYLGHKTISYEDVAGKGSKQVTFDQVPVDAATEYAAEDADITLQLHHALWPQLQAEKGLLATYQNIELPLMPVLAEIERHGVLIDADTLLKQSHELAKRIAELETQVHSLAGKSFNLSSTKQLQTILYDELKLPVIQKTPKGVPSTAEPVLQELALDFPLPKLILEYRSLTKLKSTYTDALPQQIKQQTGRIHTSYNQTGTATGRLSSSNPNLQNIPIRTEQGRRIRQAFIAPPGYKIVAIDYSQIELRIMAHLAQDQNLLQAFKNDWDVHKATAAEVFGIKLDEVNAEQRRKAKAINFGLIYGMSAFGLAKQIGVDRNTAQEYIDMYFKRYPGVKNYMDETRQNAHRLGYVQTLFGRRLYLPEINSRNLQRQRAAERAAINAPMQGTAADIIKLAMINIRQWLQKNNLDIAMIMQVHDELVFEVATQDLSQAVEHLPRIMCDPHLMQITLKVSVGVGINWDEAH
ncbi:MAG: DNA polymerase I [Gammaproteobacteria bacterium]